jgi:hypothetical protein
MMRAVLRSRKRCCSSGRAGSHVAGADLAVHVCPVYDQFSTIHLQSHLLPRAGWLANLRDGQRFLVRRNCERGGVDGVKKAGPTRIVYVKQAQQEMLAPGRGKACRQREST